MSLTHSFYVILLGAEEARAQRESEREREREREREAERQRERGRERDREGERVCLYMYGTSGCTYILIIVYDRVNKNKAVL